MAIECDDAAYEVLKREHSRLTGEAAKAKAKADTSVDVLAVIGAHDFQGRDHARPGFFFAPGWIVYG
jgi:hypothetical protein